MLPEFVIIEHPIELKDKTLVLQTSPPYCIAEIIKFDTPEKAAAFERSNVNKVWARSPTHRMYARSFGTLDGGKPNVVLVESAMNNALQAFHEMRIAPNAARFNRYKID